MMKFLFTLLTIGFANWSLGQSSCGYFYFQTQAEVDQFALDYPDCTEMDGLTIELLGSSDGITDLSALSNIAVINNALDYYNYSGDWAGTAGFASLTSAGSIYLENIHDLSGLANLTSVGTGLFIGNTNADGFESHSLAGLDNLESAVQITLAINNPSGVYENVFPSLTALGALQIGGWWGSSGFTYSMDVQTLTGFSGVTSIDQINIGINGFGTMERIDQFEIMNNLVSAGLFSSDYLLTDNWNAFQSLQTVGYFNCLAHSTTSLIEFPALTQTGDFHLWLTGDWGPQHYSFPFLQQITSLEVLEFYYNTIPLSLEMPSLEAVSGYFLITGMVATGDTEGASYSFPSLVVLPELSITNSSISSLEGFTNLTTVQATVQISANLLLSQCAIDAVCNKLVVAGGMEQILIQGNGSGCGSNEEVAAQCSGNVIQGTVYADLNCNQTFDPTDQPVPFALMLDALGEVMASTSSLGTFALDYAPGGTVQAQVNAVGFVPSGLQSWSPVEPFGLIETDLLLCPDYSFHDVSISCYAGAARPGFSTTYNVAVNNHSANSEAVVAQIDLSNLPAYVLVSSDADIISGDQLTYSNLSVPAFGSITIAFVLQVPSNTAIGTPWTVEGSCTLNAADTQLLDNAFVHQSAVIGSFDPNDISVDRSAIEYINYDLQGEWLNYVIRFQNTGNYPAEFVRVLHTLDEDLDLPSLQVLETSHMAELSFLPNRELEFFFPNIQLPDSTSDPLGSSGYIRFRIRTMPDLGSSALIEATASIYFDYNVPVITNTATTEFYTCPFSLLEQGIMEVCSGSIPLLQAAYEWDTYQWSINGTQLGAEQYQAFFDLLPGPNLVVVYATRGLCSATAEFTIQVLEQVPVPVIQLDGNALTVASGGILEWYWNGNLVQTGDEVLSLLGAGDYVVVRTIGWCNSTSEIYTYAPIPECAAPVVTGLDATVCWGEVVELAASGPFDSYTWIGNEVQWGTGASVVRAMNEVGPIALVLVAESPTCSWTLDLLLNVEALPQSPVVVQNGWQIEAAGEGEMAWQINGEAAGSSTAVEISVLGEYSATATVNGCTSTPASVEIVTCNTPLLNLTQANLCQNDEVYVDLMSGYDAYSIYIDGVVVSTTNGYYLPTDEPGLYTLGAVGVSDGCLQPEQFEYSVQPIPATPAIVQTGNTLSANVLGNCSWTFNGEPLASTSSSIEMEESGIYAVSVSLAGCASAWSEAYYEYVGVVEQRQTQWLAYPNPASDNLVLATGKNVQGSRWVILNSNGKVVCNSYIGSPSMALDVSNFARGLYWVQCIASDGKILWQEGLVLE